MSPSTFVTLYNQHLRLPPESVHGAVGELVDAVDVVDDGPLQRRDEGVPVLSVQVLNLRSHGREPHRNAVDFLVRHGEAPDFLKCAAIKIKVVTGWKLESSCIAS